MVIDDGKATLTITDKTSSQSVEISGAYSVIGNIFIINGADTKFVARLSSSTNLYFSNSGYFSQGSFTNLTSIYFA